MIKFIYFGRLTEEKWIDTIIDSFSRIYKKWIHNWHIDIYGDWPLLSTCKERSSSLPHNIQVHWRASQQTIHNALRWMHYTLMPSKVIESFWMSALESLSLWVPVIGAKVWWLVPFIEENMNIVSSSLETIIETLLLSFSSENHRKDMKQAHNVANEYTREKRREKIQHIWDMSSVFLISDYIARVWWIESILFNMKHVLEEHWSHVHMYGWKIQKWKKMNIMRKIGLIWTAVNRWQYLKLLIWQKKYKPTILWLHSVNRYLWWLPIRALHSSSTRQIWCSVHDMWMFHPFWAQVTSIDTIPNFSLAGFMSVTKNPFKKTLIALKFFSIWLLQKQLTKKVSMWFVPSAYMVDVLHKKRHIPTRKIVVLPHFI